MGFSGVKTPAELDAEYSRYIDELNAIEIRLLGYKSLLAEPSKCVSLQVDFKILNEKMENLQQAEPKQYERISEQVERIRHSYDRFIKLDDLFVDDSKLQDSFYSVTKSIKSDSATSSVDSSPRVSPSFSANNLTQMEADEKASKSNLIVDMDVLDAHVKLVIRAMQPASESRNKSRSYIDLLDGVLANTKGELQLIAAQLQSALRQQLYVLRDEKSGVLEQQDALKLIGHAFNKAIANYLVLEKKDNKITKLDFADSRQVFADVNESLKSIKGGKITIFKSKFALEDILLNYQNNLRIYLEPYFANPEKDPKTAKHPWQSALNQANDLRSQINECLEMKKPQQRRG